MNKPENNTFVPVSKAIRDTLRAEIRRTGVTAIALLRDDPQSPPGLTAGLVNRWLSGIVKCALQSHLAHVVKRWAALADDAGRVAADGTPLSRPGKRHGANRIAVTEEMSAHIRAEFVRTGLDPVSLLVKSDDIPAHLNPRIVKGWLYRDAATTEAAHWAYVTARLAATTDLSLPLPPLRRTRRKFAG